MVWEREIFFINATGERIVLIVTESPDRSSCLKQARSLCRELKRNPHPKAQELRGEVRVGEAKQRRSKRAKYDRWTKRKSTKWLRRLAGHNSLRPAAGRR